MQTHSRGQQPAPLVLGFGNVLLSDDSAGVRLVERLRSELEADAAECVDAGTMSFNLISYVEATDSILLIDAAELHSPAGTIRVFEGREMDDFLKIIRRRSVHEVGLIDLLDTARLLGCLPVRRALLCIQPHRIEWCSALSPAVEEILPLAVQKAKAVLQGWRAA
jgi:hydrogenase maturation protease